MLLILDIFTVQFTDLKGKYARLDHCTWNVIDSALAKTFHAMSRSCSISSKCQDIECISNINHTETIYDNLRTDYGEFRLLQIEPAADPTLHIITRLFKASLKNPPRYEAVSYRWEQTAKCHSISVNGVKFRVTRNVFSFLSEFRRQSHPSSPIFWIDSICINQNCTKDRNEQVQLMGKIYSTASLVRMWIGTESDLAGQAFELIRQCGTADRSPAEDVAANVMLNEIGTKAVTKLLQREYWNRVWVFQEIVLAKEAMVHCGELQAPWSSFRWLDAVSSKHILWLRAQIEHPWILEFRKALFRIAHFCISPEEAHHINNVLHPTRHLQCQDPRDKLYALRGVCRSLSWIVRVDYAIPVREVFTEFARRQVLSEKNLSALLTAGLWSPLNGADINLPSWVPDLRGMANVDIRYLAGTFTNSFDADGGAASSFDTLYPITPDDFFEIDSNSILNIHTMLFGYIQSHTLPQGISKSDIKRKELIKSFCCLTDGGKFSMLRLRQLFEGIIFSDKTTSMAGTVTEPHVWERARQLVLGFHEDLYRLFGPDPVFAQLLESFEHSASDSRQSLQEEARLCDPYSLQVSRMAYLGRAAETTERQAAALFLTVDGHLGVGLRGVANQDMVCIVRGCRVPLVLRPHGAYYKLVCPAYVSGTMQAEWVDERSGKTGFEPTQLV